LSALSGLVPPGGPNSNGNGIPNSQEPNSNGNGIPNNQERNSNGNGIPNNQEPNTNGNGIPNNQNKNNNGNGIPNNQEKNSNGNGIPNNKNKNNNGNGIPNNQDPNSPQFKGKRGTKKIGPGVRNKTMKNRGRGSKSALPIIPLSAFKNAQGNPLFPPVRKEVLQGAKPPGIVVQIDFSSKNSKISNKPYIVNDIGYENKVIDGVPVRTFISQFVAPVGNGGMKAYEVYGVSPEQIAEAVTLFKAWNESTQSPTGQIAEMAAKQAKENEKDLEELELLINKIQLDLPNIRGVFEVEIAQAYLLSLEEKKKCLALMLEASISAEKKLRDV
jgi:hypothetical protein